MTCAGAASTGSGRGRGVESDEARNTAYEGSTASGARSGATGATGTQGYSSGTTGAQGYSSGTTGTQGYSSGTTGSAGVTEGVRGLNITDKSGVSCHGLSNIFLHNLLFCCCSGVYADPVKNVVFCSTTPTPL